MNASDLTVFEDTAVGLHRTKFLILLLCQVSSALISLAIFAFFIKRPHHLTDLRHRAILLLLIVNFVQLVCDLPMAMHFYRLGYVTPATPAYCTWWTFFEYTLDVAGALLVVTISLQRHVLVFHDQLLHVTRNRWLLYYIPLLLCIVYPCTVYLIIIVILPCDGTQWDYTSNVCGFANCYLVYSKGLALFDWIAHNGTPTVVIFLANVTLVLRVIMQKHRRQQRINWKKQRRMTLQLLSISILFLIAWVPSLLIGLGQQLTTYTFLAQFQKDYALDLIYLMCLFLPWVCLGQLPEFSHWLRKRWRRQPQNLNNTIRPL